MDRARAELPSSPAHLSGDVQPPPGSVDDGDRAVSPLRSAEDLKCRAIQRMERIENLDLGAFRSQGIAGVDGRSLRCRSSLRHSLIAAGSV